MSLEVSITKVSQDMNLKNGEMENFLILELPNGSVIRAKVNEAAAQSVMGCVVNGENASQKVDQENDVPANGFREVTAPDGSSALEFGGQANGHGQVLARPRYVGADAGGNPITDGFDAGEIASGGEGADEDGVGQV